MAIENINIERQLPTHAPLQFMTSNTAKSRGPYIKRSENQDILKAFRVGDWRFGIKELKTSKLAAKCPFCCHEELSLPYFMFWCPQLDVTRKETEIYSFFLKHHSESYSDKDIIRRYLWAENDDPLIVKKHGQSIIRMQNNWYEAAILHKRNLNVRIKNTNK